MVDAIYQLHLFSLIGVTSPYGIMNIIPTPININSPHLYMLFPALHFASQIYAQLFSIHHCVTTSLTSSSKKEDVAIFFPQ